ncbi:MAG: TIGR03435 family protein [Acidobacteria bacterium]|nr:TIGR03435 family protein [Acidobacteriota bacterium]
MPGFGGRPQRGFNVRNATLAEFASVMQAQFMDLPVIDQTELGETRYTFVLTFTPDPGMRPFGGATPPPQAQPASIDPEAPPDLFSAMAQQLGLRMQKTKAPVEVMVIDKIEKPSSN